MVTTDHANEPDSFKKSSDHIENAADAEPTKEAEHAALGLSRRGAILGGGLLGLLGLGMGTVSADASGQVGTEADPLRKLFVDEIDGKIVDQDGGSDPALKSLVGGDLTIDSEGNLKTSSGPDPISVDDNKSVIQTDNENQLSGNPSNAVVLGNDNKVSGDGGVAIGGTSSFTDVGKGCVLLGGTASTAEQTGAEGSAIIAGAGTNHYATKNGAITLGGSNLDADGRNAVVSGQDQKAEGTNSFVIGFDNTTTTAANSSFVGGQGGEAQETASFIWAGDAGRDNNGNPGVTDGGVTNKVIFNANGGFEIIATDGSAPDPLLTVEGNVDVSGTVTEDSSVKYKSNIRSLLTQSSGILDIQPRRYDRIKTGDTEIGLIAEEVAEVAPELVKYNENDEPDAVNYSRVGMLLAPEVSENRDRLEEVENAHKECAETIDDLRSDLCARDARIADQADRIDQLAAENAQLTDRLTRLEGQLGTDGAVTGTTPADD